MGNDHATVRRQHGELESTSQAGPIVSPTAQTEKDAPGEPRKSGSLSIAQIHMAKRQLIQNPTDEFVTLDPSMELSPDGRRAEKCPIPATIHPLRKHILHIDPIEAEVFAGRKAGNEFPIQILVEERGRNAVGKRLVPQFQAL
jgi:hypothetical protein